MPTWRPEPLDQFADVAPHQRLAARSGGSCVTPRAMKRSAMIAISSRLSSFAARQERHLLGHAIAAAQVAAIGHRDPQIADRAAMRIASGFRSRVGAIVISSELRATVR